MDMDMNLQLMQVLFGALILSVVHAPMPNHWIPIVVVSKAENWTRGETLGATALVAIPHTISTISVGAVLGLIGHELSSTYELIMRFSAPTILVVLGLTYLFLDFKFKLKFKFEDPSQHHAQIIETEGARTKKSKLALISSLSIALFLSPCVAIGAYCFTAGTFGWMGIPLVLAIYAGVTVLGMVLMVNLGLKAVAKIEWRFLERHEKIVTGIVLIILGIFVYFMKI